MSDLTNLLSNKINIVDVHFEDYLSDNSNLLNRLLKDVHLGGQKILLDAPCGSGKTHFILTEFGKQLYELGYKLIMVCPNTIQALQNTTYSFTSEDGQEHHTHALVGNTDHSIGFWSSGLDPVCSVLDCVRFRWNTMGKHDLETVAGLIPTSNLNSKVVLVIDEAQILFMQKTFRLSAIDAIKAVAKRVIDAGGTVICMTGTPNTILADQYSHIYKCAKVDKDGNEIPAFKADRISVIHKSEKESLIKTLASVAITLAQKNKIPIVQINDRSVINRLMQYFTMRGIKALSMCSDDKGYHMEYDSTDNGYSMEAHKVYDNELYGSTIERGVLPYANIYLTTSLIEAGTSIVGVESADGTIRQPRELTPVYAVTRAGQFNIDSVEQFYNRVRFPFDECKLVMSFPSDENRLIELQTAIFRSFRTLRNDSFVRASDIAFQDDEGLNFRKYVPDVHGKTPVDNLTFDGTTYTASEFDMFGQACVNGYAMCSRTPASLKKMLSDRFGCEIVFEEASVFDEKVQKEARPIDPNTVAKFREAACKFGFDKAIMAPVFNPADPAVREVTALPDGKKLCNSYRTLMNSLGKTGALTRQECIDAAAIYAADKKAPLKTDTFQCDRIDRAVENAYIQQTLSFNDAQINQVCAASEKSYLGVDYNKDLPALDDDQKRLVSHLLSNSCRFKAACDYHTGRVTSYKSVMPWKEAVETVLNMKDSDVKWHTILENILVWNLLEPGTDIYNKVVNPSGDYLGALYHVVRTGLNTCYCDPKYKRNHPNASEMELEANARKIDKFEGQILTCYDLEQIIFLLPYEMKSFSRLKDLGRALTKSELKKFLGLMYNCTDVSNNADIRKKYNVRENDKRFYAIRIGTLRHQGKIRKRISDEELDSLLDEGDRILLGKQSADDKKVQMDIFYAKMGMAGVPNAIIRRIKGILNQWLRKGKLALQYVSGMLKRIYDVVSHNCKETVRMLLSMIPEIFEEFMEKKEAERKIREAQRKEQILAEQKRTVLEKLMSGMDGIQRFRMLQLDKKKKDAIAEFALNNSAMNMLGAGVLYDVMKEDYSPYMKKEVTYENPYFTFYWNSVTPLKTRLIISQ